MSESEPITMAGARDANSFFPVREWSWVISQGQGWRVEWFPRAKWAEEWV